jgi:signal transduction histidine kinase
MSLATPTRAVVGAPQRPYRRGVDNAVVGGVCGGLAIRLGVTERSVRITFSLLALVSGLGLLLYALLWLGVPRAGEGHSIARRLVGRRRELPLAILAVVALVIVFVVVNPFTTPVIGDFTVPVLFSLVSLVAVWHGASADERRALRELATSVPGLANPAPHNRKAFWLRLVLGVVLVAVGLRVLSRLHGVLGGATPAVFGTLILLIGVLVLLAPWWLATLGELSDERRARVRVEERAKVAAHLHDSVLQTLTLIERAAGDREAVVRLARRQERELRQWLFSPDEATDDGTTSTLSSALRDLEDEIEGDYGVRIDTVVVGDCEVDDDVTDLVAAGREAVINAARWSAATSVAVYAEVEAEQATLFVRDRGRGFDVDAVPTDRHGIALSMRERMARHGGTVTIRSSPGAGTEVQLTLPRGS